MTDCDHPIDKIARLDPGGRGAALPGLTRDGAHLTIWGECECGTATLVSAEITDIEEDNHD